MEYRDVIRCASCGGKCCQLYIKRCEGGQMPDYIHYANDNILDDTQNFDYYFKHSVWYLQKDRFDVEPQYDVLEAYSAWLDSYIYDDSSVRKIEALRCLKELNDRGINMGYCAYWTKEGGCIIAWENVLLISKNIDAGNGLTKRMKWSVYSMKHNLKLQLLIIHITGIYCL